MYRFSKRERHKQNFRVWTIGSLLIVLGLILFGCSQPVLESEECIASRDSVKSFYSFHFGNDMKPTEENLKKRSKYLSSELNTKLSEASKSERDYFTQTDDYPKAFRAGKCSSNANGSALFEILLFWRSDEQDSQREIHLEAIKENESWVINKVSSKK